MMTTKDYEERLKKAELNVEKRLNTIEKQKKQIEKKKAVLERCSWIDVEKLDEVKWDEKARARYQEEVNETYKDALYWDACDYESACETVRESYKKLEDLQKIVENWKVKLAKSVEKDSVWENEIPECLKNYKEYLVKQWDEFDKKNNARLLKEYDEIGYTEFVRKYKYTTLLSARRTDEEVHSENVRSAYYLIMDLYNRVYKYIGEIESWLDLGVSDGHINGWVRGKEKSAKVESILAGGYNIQRLHVRVLVHAYDNK